ncbi:MAG: hypothetical protein R3B49_07815 [Phycisphaerales bacterium]
MASTFSRASLCSVGILLGAAGSARADLYGIRFAERGPLYRIDEVTGASTRVGFTEIVNPGGLDLGADGMLYTFSRETQTVYRVDPATAAATAIGAMGIEFQLEGGLAVDSATSAYAVAGFVENDIIVQESVVMRVDLTTGAATEIGRVDLPDLSGITIRSDGMLVVFSAGSGTFYEVDPVTLAYTPIVTTFISASAAGLTSDGTTGYLHNADDLYTVNLFTGEGEALSTTGRVDISGLAVAPTDVCAADCDGSGTLNLDDIACFAGAFIGGDLAADCDGSGTLNLDDIECFATGFIAGCP